MKTSETSCKLSTLSYLCLNQTHVSKWIYANSESSTSRLKKVESLSRKKEIDFVECLACLIFSNSKYEESPNV